MAFQWGTIADTDGSVDSSTAVQQGDALGTAAAFKRGFERNSSGTAAQRRFEDMPLNPQGRAGAGMLRRRGQQDVDMGKK